jgi:hypothetical protein
MDNLEDVYYELFPEMFHEKNMQNCINDFNKCSNTDCPKLSKKKKEYWMDLFKKEGSTALEIKERLENVELYMQLKKEVGVEGHDGHTDAIYLSDGVYILPDGTMQSDGNH